VLDQQIKIFRNLKAKNASVDLRPLRHLRAEEEQHFPILEPLDKGAKQSQSDLKNNEDI
jgi:hypothetical protein